MIVLQDTWYVIQWPLYIVALVFHRLYQFTVFLSKPGARLICLYLAHAATLWLHVKHEGIPSFDPNATWQVWWNTAIGWLSFDYASRGLLAYPELVLLCFAFVLHFLPAELLKGALGLFPAKARPLPPIKPVRVPKLKIRAVQVRCAVKRMWRWL